MKSLVFVCDGRPVLALVPGDRRADPAKVAAAAGARAARVGSPEEVVAATGFEPGAVAPFPAPKVTRVLLERRLLLHETVWIGAGSPGTWPGSRRSTSSRLAAAEAVDLAE